MGYEDLANLTHKMENVLDAIRNGKLSVTPDIIDVIFTAVDHLERWWNRLQTVGTANWM